MSVTEIAQVSKVAKDLTSYVRENFSNDLSKAELQLLDNAQRGKSETSWTEGVHEEFWKQDWASIQKWDETHVVRAELVRFLCTDTDAQKFIDPRGIHVRNVWIERREERRPIEKARDDLDIDLDSTTIPFSLYFKHCVIPHGVQMRDATTKFVAFQNCHIGELRLDRANVKGILLLSGNRVRRPISIRQAVVDGALSLRNTRISYSGEDRASSCVPGNEQGTGERSMFDVDLSWTSVENELVLVGLDVEGTINLEQAKVGSLSDTMSIYRHPPHLRGFEYTVLEKMEDLQERLDRWLKEASEKGYRQPYDEFAKWLRGDGHEADATRVAIAREAMVRRKRRFARGPFLGTIGSFWSGIYWALTAYGYRPVQLAAWFISLYAFGYWVFSEAYDNKVIQAKDGASGSFYAWTYTADVMLPVAALGPDKEWTIKSVDSAPYVVLGTIRAFRLDDVAVATRAVLKVFGWVAGILLIAAATRKMVRSD